ncbi:MAG: EAL domain-containing protein [Nitrosomonadales bacterium]|nr:EAL domain-containing protein [Nitrosomonadales bacterium]
MKISINQFNLARQLFVAFLSVACLMALYEFLQATFLPALTVWQSHLLTILFASLLATVAVMVVVLRARLASLIYEISSDAIFIVDNRSRIVKVNAAFAEITGYGLQEVIGQTPNILRSGRHDEAFYAAMWESLNLTGKWQGEIWNRRKNGEIYPEWLVIKTIFNKDGSVYRRIGVFTDVTEKKKLEELAWQQANYDALTGLPNRRMFHDRLGQAAKKSHRTGLPAALMLIDLDRFKEINDTLGHDMGDLLLVTAAQRITSCIRESDTVARLGGDEFAVILPELDGINSVGRIAQEILTRLIEPFHLGSEEAYISGSIGVSLYPNDTNALDVLFKNADQAMYVAKNAGRNGFSYFTPDLHEAAQKRLHLTNDLHTALAHGQFHVYYQPIIELASGRIYKAEALVRWQHPVRGFVSPDIFVPLAEETGLIVQIGDWVFMQAIMQLKQWRSTYNEPFQLSINKSPVQLRINKSSRISWLAYLKEQGIDGQSITIEVTEKLLMNAESKVNEKLMKYREAGIQISIDDFGTGYSSLVYLKKFDIDYLKIDGKFVRNLVADTNDLAICEAIIVMAHKMGFKVVAEGVETPEQRDLLISAGCDYAQGYLFSKPVPAEEFEQLLHAR